MTFDPDTIYRQVVECGESWADKKAAYEALDDLTKTIYADLVTNYLPPTCATKGEAELRAYTDNDYKAHLAAKSKARREWLLAEVKYKGVQLLSELRRSEESSRRAEMRL